jgi:hypothetical protein
MENGKWKKIERGGMEIGKGEMEIRVYVIKSRKWKMEKPGKGEMKNIKGEMENGKWKKTR